MVNNKSFFIEVMQTILSYRRLKLFFFAAVGCFHAGCCGGGGSSRKVSDTAAGDTAGNADAGGVGSGGRFFDAVADHSCRGR